MYGWEARVVFNSLKLFNCPVVLKFTDRTKFAKALLICRLYLFVDNFSFMLMLLMKKDANKDAITFFSMLGLRKPNINLTRQQ